MKMIFVFAMGLLVSSRAFSQGTLVFDQTSSSGGLAGGGSFIQNQQPMGQSFTPTFSSVGFVQFQFADTVGTQGATVYVRLLEGSVLGTLLSTSFPVNLPNGFFGVTNFFFPAQVSVVAGSSISLIWHTKRVIMF